MLSLHFENGFVHYFKWDHIVTLSLDYPCFYNWLFCGNNIDERDDEKKTNRFAYLLFVGFLQIFSFCIRIYCQKHDINALLNNYPMIRYPLCTCIRMYVQLYTKRWRWRYFSASKNNNLNLRTFICSFRIVSSFNKFCRTERQKWFVLFIKTKDKQEIILLIIFRVLCVCFFFHWDNWKAHCKVVVFKSSKFCAE